MVLLIDNYDSFTYNLYQYFRILDKDVLVVRNDKLDVAEVSALAPEYIVISPGPGGPDATGNCRSILKVFAGRVPILGICLGMQVLADYYGGIVVRAPSPVHGKTSEIFHDGRGVFRGLPQNLSVTRYHSLMVERETLPDCLEVTASNSEGIIMGLRHKTLKVEGVQFHPEAYLTDYGLDMIRNSMDSGAVC